MTRLQPTILLLSLGLVVGAYPRTAAAQVPGPPPVKDDSPPPKAKADEPPKPKADEPPKPAEPPKPEPAKLSKEAKARIDDAKKAAATMGKYGDWLSAADELQQAYLLVADPALAFKVGEAAHKAKDCVRAKTYLERFLEASEFGDQPQSMVIDAKKMLNELETFECPARTTDDKAALAETLARQAKLLADESDWLGAALAYSEAYELAPKRTVLAYEVGVAAWNAHECSDSVSYFYHFRDSEAAKQHKKELKQTGKYIDDSEAGKCKPWGDDAKAAHARDLYAQGQNHEFALEYLDAAGKYERARLLLPENLILSFRAAEVYWTAHHCDDAKPNYQLFVEQATAGKFDRDRKKSEEILARIRSHGCPDALWNTQVLSGGAGSSDSSEGGGGTDSETPPPIGGGGGSGSSIACSVDEPGGAGGLFGFGLVVLAGLLRRRRQ